MLDAYRKHVEERAAEGVVPKPLDEQQTAELVELLKTPAGEEAFLLDLLTNRVPPGVDQAAYVKAGFLAAITRGDAQSPLIDRAKATELLGTMLGGYNIEPLVKLIDDQDEAVAGLATDALCKTLLVFDAFHDIEEKAKAGSANAKRILQSWADGEWFTSRPELPEKLSYTVFKVEGETNTDDLSPAQDAWSRPDIPLHANAMLKNERPGITNALQQIADEKEKGLPLAYVGDVVGTGSSRKSATNSVLWHMGDDIPFVPTARVASA